MKFLLFIVLALTSFQDVPFKNKDEFDLKLNMEFKNRPVNQNTTVYATAKNSSDLLPYITLDLAILKVLDDESKIKILDFNEKVLQVVNLSKKTNFQIDLGFSADLKDRVSSHQYYVNFYSTEKELKRKIFIEFLKDGSYLVNGETRGKI